MSLKSPSNLRYTIVIGATETILVSDPKGWDEESVARTRTEDFGVNSEITVPLSFVNDGYNLLQPLYLSKGQFAVAYLKIEKRTNEWDYELFYKYRLDFSKANDKLYEFEIPGIEEGLAVKFEKYKDTEYEIDLPIANKIFIDYTGASYTDKNTIQCGYGKMSEKDGIGDDFYVLKGERSVRSYTDKLAFTDSDGVPYETMTFRALKTATIPIDIFMNVSIEADAYFNFSTPARGSIFLVKHNADFTSPSAVTGASQINPYTSATPANNRIDYFNEETTWNISVVKDGIYSFFYMADVTKDYDGVNILEGSNCRIEFSILTESAYQNAKLEAFTYEWLIAELLKKIDSNATFESTITYPNVKELLSATPCIINMGKTNGTGKLKTTLKDVLESYHKLHCTAIDITGNKMTITPLADVYNSSENNGTLEVSNITVMHDTKHQYNKVKVGADTDDRDNDDPLIYPFICEKEYSVENSLAVAELDLVNNFMLDPYAIDKYMRETLAQNDNKDECKFMVLVIGGFTGTVEHSSGILEEYQSQVDGLDTMLYFYDVDLISNSKPQLIIQTEIGDEPSLGNPFFKYTFNEKDSAIYRVRLKIDCYTVNEIIGNAFGIGNWLPYEPESYKRSVTKTENRYIVDFDFIFKSTLDEDGDNSYFRFEFNFDNISSVNFTEFSFSAEYIYSEYSWSEIVPIYTLYRGHNKPITNFVGDSNTIYNIPLTPSRILQRWADYLAVSVVGSDSKKLKFQSSTIKNSGITSKCDYEAAAIKEDTDFDLSGAKATFLPALINFDTYNDYDRILDDNPYGYYSLVDKKTGRALQGYVNKTTYAVGANQTQQWELQAKEI